VILRPENRAILRTGFVAWLTAAPDVLWHRIHADATTAPRRPNLTAAGGLEEVVRLLAVREPLYRDVADVTVPTEGKSPDAVAADILQAWGAASV
jgi:shikimate kinase